MAYSAPFLPVTGAVLTAPQLAGLCDDITDLDRRTSPVTSVYAGTQSGIVGTSYASLPTFTPAISVIIGANRKAQVGIFGAISNSTSNFTLLGFAVSGAATINASDRYSLQTATPSDVRNGAVFILDSTFGLNPGSTTFTLKARVTAGSGSVSDPQIWATPLSA